MGLLGNIFSTIKSAFTPGSAPTNILTPEAQARLAITTPGTAGARIAATTPGTAGAARIAALPPVLQPPRPPIAPIPPPPKPSALPPAGAALLRGAGLSSVTMPKLTPTVTAPQISLGEDIGRLGEGIKGIGGFLGSFLNPEIPQVIRPAQPLTPGLDFRGRGTPAGLLAGIQSDVLSFIKGTTTSEKDRFNEQVADVKVEAPDISEEDKGAISGAIVVRDPNTGKGTVVVDGKTQADAAEDLKIGTKQVQVDNNDRRQAEGRGLIEQQNENAIKGVADFLNMDEATVRGLVDTDPNVRILYDELFKKAKAAQNASNYVISDENTGNITGGIPSGTTPPPVPGFNALETFKSFMDAAGVPVLNTEIKDLEEDYASVANFYQTRRDEIKDNPEFPQWLKARRDEFVGKAQDRALTLYENRLKAKKEDRDRREKLAIDYYNASVKQYELQLTAKRDALNEADTYADNDRQLLGDYLKYFADTGTNWSDLSYQQQENIRRQFTDPEAVEALGTFDFKNAYDNQVTLDWARVNSSSSYKPTTTQVGDVVYQVTYGPGGEPSYKPLGRAGAPTKAQTREDLIDWMTLNSGLFEKGDLKSVADSIDEELRDDDGIINAINTNAAKKEGKFMGLFGGKYPTALSEEDPITSFRNFQNSKAFGGIGGGTTTGAGGLVYLQAPDGTTYEYDAGDPEIEEALRSGYIRVQ